MSLEDVANYSLMSKDEKIIYLEGQVNELEISNEELNRALALQNQDKIDKLEGYKDEDFFRKESPLEAFSFYSHTGESYVKCDISQHKDSEFIYINFLPIDSAPLSICMTEKSFEKFANTINKFKEKK